MKRLMERFIINRHHLILEEQDVLNTLRVIQKHHKVVPDMRVGNCGWMDDENKWFIHFDTTDSKWRLIRNELRIIRIFENADIPKNTVGKIYSTD